MASLLLGEFVVPPANREREEIYDGQIRGVRREIAHERPDLTYVGHGGNVYYMRLYVVREQRMHEVALQSFEDGQLVRIAGPAVVEQFALPFAEPADGYHADLDADHFVGECHSLQMQADEFHELPLLGRGLDQPDAERGRLAAGVTESA